MTAHFQKEAVYKKGLNQGCPKLILEGRCPVGYRCFTTSTHLDRIWTSLD